MTDRLQAAREALEPFAEEYRIIAEAEAETGIKTPRDMNVDMASIAGTPLTVADLERANEALALLQSGPDTSRQSSETAKQIVAAIELKTEGADFDWEADIVIDEPKSIANVTNILAALDAAAEGQGWQNGVNAAIRVIERGYFLHDDAPPARFAREVVAAIKREAKPPVSASKPEGARPHEARSKDEVWPDNGRDHPRGGSAAPLTPRSKREGA